MNDWAPPILSLTGALEPLLNGSRQQLLVTGAARSGTGYTAEVLAHALSLRLGRRCLHEGYFSPALCGSMPPRPSMRLPAPVGGVLGDVSWLGAPYVWNGALDRSQWWVGMLVRHPLHAINSIIRRGFLHPNSKTWYGYYAWRHTSISSPGHPILNAIWYWVQWHESLLDGSPDQRDCPDFLWQVEGLAGQHRFPVIAGSNPTPDGKGDETTPLLEGLGDLDGPKYAGLGEKVRALGRRLGYDV